jgi:hypothetical protein
MHQKLNEVDVPPESRKNFKKVITYIMNLMTESKCRVDYVDRSFVSQSRAISMFKIRLIT